MEKTKVKICFGSFLSCLILIATFTSPTLKAQDDVNKTLTIAYRTDSAPLQYQDKSGHAQGVIIDFWRVWAKKSKKKLVFIGGNNRETQQWLAEGEVDAIAGLFKSAQREKTMLFSEPLLHSAYSLYYNPKLISSKKNVDINLHSIGVTESSFHHQWLLKNYPQANIHTYQGYNQLFKAAINGDVEMFITQAIHLQRYINKHPTNTHFESLSNVLYDQAYRAAVNINNSPLMDKINAQLNNISNQDRNEISAKWSGFHWQYLPPSSSSKSHSQFQLTLSEQDRTWLKLHPVIDIGLDGHWPPVDYIDPQGNHSGIISEYLKLIENRLGIKFAIRTFGGFKPMLEQLRSGNIPVGATIVQTKEREQDLWFSHPYFSAVKVIASNSDGIQYTSLKQMAGKTLAIEDGFFLIDVLRRLYPEIILKTFPSSAAALKALSFKKVDAYIGNQAVISWLTQNLQLSNITFSGDPKLPFSLQRFAIHKDPQWKIFVSILDKALTSITITEQQSIINRWVNNQQQSLNAIPLNLNRKQEIWLDKHQAWRVGIDPNFAPFSFNNDKENFKGISAEILDVLTNLLGINSDVITSSSWQRSLTLFYQDQIDILPSVSYADETKQNMLLSKPYITSPYMIFVENNTKLVTDVNDLNNSRVGVLANYPIAKQLHKKNPALDLVLFDSTQDALISLSSGEINAFIGVLDASSWTLSDLGITNIKIAAPTQYQYQAAIGVRKDWPELIPILNQVIDRLTDQQIKRIKNRWFSVEFEHQASNYLIWRAIVITCLLVLPIIIVIFIWNRKLSVAKDNLSLSKQKLAEAKLSAEQANNFKSQFLANMSHEIRTPMNAIVGFTHLMLGTELQDTQRDYAQKIKRASLTLLGVINDILDVSKVEAGKLDIENVNFHLHEIVASLSNLFAPKAAEKNIGIFMDIDPNIPDYLIGDPLRLEQILINLIQNALKFTEQGEVIIKINLVDIQKDIATIKFAVLDTGIGISEDKLTLLFQPFVQADGSNTRTHGGTGLGLSISKLLVELLGGRIEAKSIEGQGSTFSFVLSLAFNPEKQYSEQLQPELKGMRVLIVDDNKLARHIASEILQSFSFRVDSVNNAATAIEMLDFHNRQQSLDPYQLVLMDWRMPKMNGIDASNYIKSMPLHLIPAIILVTAYGREEVLFQVEKEQLDAFVIKPINASLLFDCIIKVFHQKPINSPPISALTSNQLQGRVLLVEDHAINQEVAREMLKQTGVEIHVANNGQEAVNQVENSNFDLILMDIQMPVLDGYEATKIIRKTNALTDLPIVAMTAHAMKEDQQRCLDVGMNAHLAKPIDPEQLFSTLKQFLHNSKSTPEILEHQSNTVLSPIEGLDIQWGVTRVGGNSTLYQTLLYDFYTRHKNDLDQIHQAFQQKSFDDVKRITHTIRGVAGNLGAMELQQAAEEFEIQLTDKDPSIHSAQWRTFQYSFQKLFDNLSQSSVIQQNQRPSIETSDANTKDKIAIQTQLESLRELLEAGDPQAKKTIIQLQHDLSDSLYNELSTLINEFEFDNALSVLNKQLDQL